ncbi:MAG: TIGR03943 family protein [Actinomycetota bacterium]
MTRQRLHLVVVAAWAVFFVWLIATGEIVRYIGPRTKWVVWFGAAALIATGIALAVVARRPDPRRAAPLGVGETIGILALLLPIVAVVVVPQPNLGALGASRKLIGGLAATGGFVPVPDGGAVSFQEISFASRSPGYAASLGVSEGVPVDLTGFVTHPAGSPPGTFALTRFAIFCCAADATPYSVAVDPTGAAGNDDFPDDTWLTVKGALARVDGSFVLLADDIIAVDEPKDPYVY